MYAMKIIYGDAKADLLSILVVVMPVELSLPRKEGEMDAPNLAILSVHYTGAI
jgi:hypothetical protein